MTDKPDFDTNLWTRMLEGVEIRLPPAGVDDPTSPAELPEDSSGPPLAIQLPNSQVLPISAATIQRAQELIDALAHEVSTEEHGMPVQSAAIWERKEVSSKLLAGYLTIFSIPSIMRWNSEQEHDVHIDAATAFLREAIMPKLFHNTENAPIGAFRAYARLFTIAGKLYQFLGECPIVE